MPANADAMISARGGAARWRTVTLPNGRRALVAITRRPGPRGGRTVIVRVTRKGAK